MWTILFLAANAAPFELDHQTRLVDSAGVPLNGDVSLAMEFFDGAGLTAQSLGTLPAQTVPADDGYATMSLSVDSSLFEAGDVWIEYTVDSQVLEPRVRIAHVPRAIVAETALALTPFDGSLTCSTDGAIRWDQPNHRLLVCSSGGWTAVATSPLLAQVGGHLQYNDGTSAVSCAAYLATNATAADGTYTIQPPGYAAAFPVYCDMTGGGWTVIQSVASPAEGNLASYPSFTRTVSVVAGDASHAELGSTDTGFSLGSNGGGVRKTAQMEIDVGFSFSEMQGSWVGYGRISGTHHDDNQTGSTTWVSQGTGSTSTGIVQFGTPGRVVKTGGQWGSNWNQSNATRTYSFDVTGLTDSVIRWRVVDQSDPEWADFRDIDIRVR